jgi:hypothetical protein
MGCSRRLREQKPGVRIVAVEPYLGHKIQGLKNLKEAYARGSTRPRRTTRSAASTTRPPTRWRGALPARRACCGGHERRRQRRRRLRGRARARLGRGGDRALRRRRALPQHPAVPGEPGEGAGGDPGAAHLPRPRSPAATSRSRRSPRAGRSPCTPAGPRSTSGRTSACSGAWWPRISCGERSRARGTRCVTS